MKVEMDKDFRGNAYIVHNDEVIMSYSCGFEITNTFEIS